MPKPEPRNAFTDKMNKSNTNGITSDTLTDNDNVLPPVKRRKSDGMRQVGMRMPGAVYEDWVAWCEAREYAIGPTAGAALREYMARHAAD